MCMSCSLSCCTTHSVASFSLRFFLVKYILQIDIAIGHALLLAEQRLDALGEFSPVRLISSACIDPEVLHAILLCLSHLYLLM